MFKVGDYVIKAHPWSTTTYCRHGGTQKDVPIGTRGNILQIGESILVIFHNGERWAVDPSEIEHEDVMDLEIDNKIYTVKIMEIKEKT